MTYSLINKCAKNYYNRTFIVQVIAKNVVTCFFLRHSVVIDHAWFSININIGACFALFPTYATSGHCTRIACYYIRYLPDKCDMLHFREILLLSSERLGLPDITASMLGAAELGLQHFSNGLALYRFVYNSIVIDVISTTRLLIHVCWAEIVMWESAIWTSALDARSC